MDKNPVIILIEKHQKARSRMFDHISDFYIKKKKDHSKTRNMKSGYTTFKASFEEVQNDMIQINLKL